MILRNIAKLLILFFVLIIGRISEAEEPSESELKQSPQWLVVPGGVWLNGPGPVWGLGAGLRQIHNGSIDLLAGKTFGKNRGWGLMIRDVPAWSEVLRLSLFTASLEELSLETSYSRGLESDSPLQQKIHGQGHGILGDLSFSQDQLRINWGIIQTKVGFGGYETVDGDTIELPDAFLPDVKSLNLVFGIKWNSYVKDSGDQTGWSAGLGLKTDSGRTGQADQLVSTLETAAWINLHPLISIRGRIKSSDASILKRQEKYETREGVLGALKVNCESLSGDAAIRCHKLKNELADYIAANNKFGTANPGGGAGGLRGYRELQIKAASLRIVSMEFPFLISALFGDGLFTNPKYKLEFVPFVDLGYSSDRQSTLYKKSALSRGASLRLFLDKLPLRLSYAKGEGKPVWFFTVGLPW